MIDIDTQPFQYRTSDTALAAFLIERGYNKPDIEQDGRRSFWIFLTNNPHIDEDVRDWELARAMTNGVLFFNAYKNLIRRLKEGF